MYKTQKMSTLTHPPLDGGYEGETIEQKINRIVNNKEPITDGAPLIYTERKAGVMPAYNIRTDRFEIAVEAMDKVTKTEIARREQRQAERTEKQKKEIGEPKPIQGTPDNLTIAGQQ